MLTLYVRAGRLFEYMFFFIRIKFIRIKFISILRLRFPKTKHILSIFLSLIFV